MQQFFLTFVRLSFLLSLVTTSAVLNAESLESLLMPGEVIKGHEKVEHECTQCHDTASKDKQGQLCVKCHAHDNILNDLIKNSGFHGRLSKSTQNDCKHCHTEHKGRDANIVLLNLSTFDHRKTDFVLEGTHTKVSCNACHKSDKKYSEAPSDCYSCHKKSDVHKGKQGEKCGSCHTSNNWKETGFDHDKTDFPLKASHKDASCAACHVNEKYKDTPKNCFDCHQIDDVHRGDLGKKCDSCHNSKKWDDILFDHNKKTDFPLYGKHSEAACNSCHTSDDLKSKESKKKLPKECYGCHKNDDSHKGQYGKECKTCHTSKSWQKQKFDHDKKTDFPLHGKHKNVDCTQCHKSNLYKDKANLKDKKATRCIDCHKADDVHKGNQGDKCDSCHNENGWNENLVFDHDLTSFPLIGMHAVSQCEECHLSTAYADTRSDCNHCHADDDTHKTRLGTNCESCHNPNSWETWLFDHDKDTDFTLDGAHKKIGCYDCHQTESKGKLQASKDCISCHRNQDIHSRQFGGRCGECHSTKSFKDININKYK